jgi:hypothetical protein
VSVLALVIALSTAAQAPSTSATPTAVAPSAPLLNSSLSKATLQAASQALEDVSVGKLVGVYVQASTPELAQAAQSLLIDAFQKKGAKAALPLSATSGTEAEAKAREAGMDMLVRVRVGLEGTDLTLAGDRIGTWVNFWDGKTEVRQLGSATLAARTTADASVLTLSRVVGVQPEQLIAPPTVNTTVHYGVDPIARVPARVLALTLLDADGDGRPELAALTPTEVLLLRPDGEILARRDHSLLPEAVHPSRDPSGGLVTVDGPKGHRLLYTFSGQARGESLAADRTGLHALSLADQTPLCVSSAGLVTSTIVEGTNLYGPDVRMSGVVHTLAQPVLALRANPAPGDPALLALYADGQAQPLSGTLTELGAPLVGVGEAALADLDGDGIPELVVSSSAPAGPSDQVRILKPGQSVPVFQSELLSGAVLASIAGDIDGDGKADVVLAVVQADGSTTLYRVGIKP